MKPSPAASQTSIAVAAFSVEVLGRTLGTFGSIKGLEAQVDVLEYREGGINDLVHRLPVQRIGKASAARTSRARSSRSPMPGCR